MDKQKLDRLWADPRNWNLIGYHCKADPRLFVPKRNDNMGYALNTAHPKSFLALAKMLALAILPAPIFLTVAGPNQKPLTLVLLLGLSVLLCVWYMLRVVRRDNP